jgi:hypothetical protein
MSNFKITKYPFLFTIGFIMCFSQAYSQNIVDSLDWVVGFQDKGLSPFLLETDSQNNTFLAAAYGGCDYCFISNDGDTIVDKGNGFSDVFLAKLNNNGTLIDYYLIGGEGHENIVDFEINVNDDIIIYIQSDSSFFENNVFVEKGYSIVKFNNQMELQWSKNIVGTSHYLLNANSQIYSNYNQMEISNENDIIITGRVPTLPNYDIVLDTLFEQEDTFYIYDYYYDSLEIENYIFQPNAPNGYIASFNFEGNLNWVKTLEHEGGLSTRSITVTNNGDIALIGTYANEVWIVENDTLDLDSSGNGIPYVMFVSRFNKYGDNLFTKRYYQNSFPKFLTSDSDNNILVAAAFDRETFFENDTISSISAASDQLFLNINPLGEINWNKRQGDQYTNQIVHVKYNNRDQLFASGDLYRPNTGAILYGFNNTGIQLWRLNPSASSNRHGAEFDFSADGGLVLTGTYNGSFGIDNQVIPNSTNQWAQFITKFKGQADRLSPKTFFGELLFETTKPTCGEPNGNVSVSSSIGMTFTDIIWSNGKKSQKIEDLVPGVYSVTVKDIYGNSASQSITIEPEISLQYDISSQDATCNEENGIIEILNINGVDISSIILNGNEAAYQNFNLSSDEYLMEIIDINNCSFYDTITIDSVFVHPLFVLNDTTSCGLDDGYLSALSISNILFDKYEWSNGDTTQGITNLAGGPYTVTVTDYNGCTQVAEAIVHSPDFPYVNLGNDTLLNQGQELFLDVFLNGNSYLWNTGDITASIVVSTPGLYSVTVTNIDGCMANDTIMVDYTSSTTEYEENSIRIWPNPVNESLNISSIETLKSVYIYGRDGKFLYKVDENQLNKNNGTINVLPLVEGCYYLKVVTLKKAYVKAFIKY